ncbi:phage tail tape measure protein [Bacillus sp. AFS018417]|nr:phage tail tape measure protein [Bacillus sp. AFS018417]
MNGQVQYAQTLKEINMVMNNAAKEYKNHIAAMGQDASATDKLIAEKKKLEIQMEAAKKRTEMLRAEYTAMAKDTNTTAEQLNRMYGKLLDAERAETSLANSMKRVTEGLSEEAQEARKAQEDLEKLKQGTKLLEAEQKSLASAFKLQNAELGANADEFDRLDLAYEQLQQQMKLTDRVVQNLEQQLEVAKHAYGENSVEVKQLETKLNEARTTLKNFENALENAGRSADKAADDLEQLGHKMDLNNMLEATEILQGMSEQLIGFGKSTMDTAIEFDNSQRKIQASLGLTGKGAENLEKIAENTWKKGFGENIEEVDQALIKVFQNMKDVPHEELQMASEDVLTLAKIYDVDLNEATRGAGQLMSQFGLSTQETFDLLSAGAQSGLNYSDELFDNLSEYAPLFKQAGFSADEMFTILANGTQSGSYNLDYINDLVKEFGIRVQDGSKGVSEGFGDLSESTQEVWKSFNEGKATAADVFNAVLGDLRNMDDKVKANQIGVALFGTKWEDMGAQAVLSLNDVNGGLGDTKGSMEEMKKIQEESFGQQFQSMLRETKAALEPLGKVLIDIAKDILPAISKSIKTVSDLFSKLPAPVQTFTVVLGALSAAFIILTPIVAALAISFMTLDVAILPIIAIIAAVALAITGIILVIQNWGEIVDWLSEKWSQFSTWLGELWQGIVQVCSDAWNSTVEFFSQAWSSFLEMAHSFFEPLAEFFSQLWSSIVETASNFLGQLTQAWSNTWNTILTILDPIISLLKTLLEGAWLAITAAAQVAWALFSKYIIDPVTAAYNWCKEKFGDLVSWLSQKWESLKSMTLSAWNSVKQHIIEPISSAYNGVVEKVISMYNAAVDKFNFIKNAATENFNAAKNAIVNPIKEAADMVKGWLDKISEFFSNLKLKIPKPELPPLPHFSLKTSKKEVAGKTISYPSGIDVDWRAKGGIFTQPTIFGMSNGRLQGAGEAGPEAVLPLNKETLGTIGDAISANMGGDVVVHVYLDVDEVNTKLAPGMSQKINQNNKITARSRGVIT